jgi:riboflavin transporter FmnP
MKKTKNLTFCSLMVALSVVLLFLCSFIEALDLTAVLLSSVCVFITDE